jgi:hypothetical protein
MMCFMSPLILSFMYWVDRLVSSPLFMYVDRLVLHPCL